MFSARASRVVGRPSSVVCRRALEDLVFFKMQAGVTSLSYACGSDAFSEPIIRLLLSSGADPNICDERRLVEIRVLHSR